MAAQAEEARGLLAERDEGATRSLAQQAELEGQRSELQNTQRQLFQRESELGM